MDFVVKARAGDELTKAIRSVLQGKRYVSKGLPETIYAKFSSIDFETM
jgi:hypothetical protein